MLKKIKVLSILSVFIVAAMACSTDNSEEVGGVVALKVTPEDIVDPASIMEEVSFIPLLIPEGAQINLFGYDPKVAITDYMYISTGDFRDGSLHQFDLNGNFVKTINRTGKGPGEYERIDELRQDREENIVIATVPQYLHVYSPQLDYKETIPTPREYYFRDFADYGNGKWFFATDQHKGMNDAGYWQNFGIFDPKNDSVTFLNIMAPPIAFSLVEGSMARFQDGFLLNYGASDTLYHFVNGEVKPLYSLDLAGRNMPKSMKDAKDEDDEILERILMEQSHSLNMGVVATIGDYIKIKTFGLIKKNFDPEDPDFSPMGLPVHDVFINSKTHTVKAIGSIGNFGSNDVLSEGYFYHFLYMEQWQNMIEYNILGDEITAKLIEASKALNDQEDPIMLRFKLAF